MDFPALTNAAVDSRIDMVKVWLRGASSITYSLVSRAYCNVGRMFCHLFTFEMCPTRASHAVFCLLIRFASDVSPCYFLFRSVNKYKLDREIGGPAHFVL